MASCRFNLIPFALLNIIVFAGLSFPGRAATNILFSGRDGLLGPQQSLVNGQYTLIMQQDCNLVLYNGNTALFGTGTANMGTNCNLMITPYGELLVYGSTQQVPTGRVLWRNNAGSTAVGSYVLVLTNNGALRVYGPTTWLGPPALKSTSVKASCQSASQGGNNNAVLYSGTVVPIGSVIDNDCYKISLLDDCNLIYSDTVKGRIWWESGSSSRAHDCYLTLEANGELKVNSQGGKKVLWSNEVKSYDGEYVMAMKPTGEIAVYGPAVWKTAVTAAVDAA